MAPKRKCKYLDMAECRCTCEDELKRRKKYSSTDYVSCSGSDYCTFYQTEDIIKEEVSGDAKKD